jgi:hypothetical protein
MFAADMVNSNAYADVSLIEIMMIQQTAYRIIQHGPCGQLEASHGIVVPRSLAQIQWNMVLYLVED